MRPLPANAAAAYWDELEKISGAVTTGLVTGVTAGLTGAALGLGGTAMYLHGNAQQDRQLRDMGVLNADDAQHRQMKRVAAMIGVASAMGIGGAALGGIGAPIAQKYVGNAIEHATRGMWETAGNNFQRALNDGLERQVKSGDKLLRKQMEYGQAAAEKAAPRIARSSGREFLGGLGESLPLIGRFFKKKVKRSLKPPGMR
jgi:hypothetical protein